jgi:predicted nucleic acid-binding protein
VIVVADTSPINYLVLIGELELLPQLYSRVLIPPAVHRELTREASPQAVRAWIAELPAWLEVRAPQRYSDSRLDRLGDGEREAILLAEELRADRVLVDDFKGRQEVIRRRIPFTGTIGVLAAAADKNLINFDLAIARLLRTNFRASAEVIERVRNSLRQS